MAFRISLIVTFILLLVNVYIFFNRDNFSFSNQVAYHYLYPEVSSIAINNISKVGQDQLEFELKDSTKKTTWKIFRDGLLQGAVSGNPTLVLSEGLYHYKAISATDSLLVRAEYIPPQKNKASFIVLEKTNIARNLPGEVKGIETYNPAATDEEKKYVQQIVNDSIGIIPTMTPAEKVMLICRFLHARIYASAGSPTDSTLSLSSLQQYYAACRGEEIWCGIFAGIFNLFATEAGVKCRDIELINSIYGIQGSAHVMNEYFDPEKNRWRMVDVMFNATSVYSAGRNPMNVVQVNHLQLNDNPVMIEKIAGDSLVLEPLSKMPKAFLAVYGIENDLYIYDSNIEKFSGVLGKMENYLSPSKQYIFYSDSRIADNRNFYIKQFAALLLILSGVVTILFFCLKRKKLLKKY